MSNAICTLPMPANEPVLGYLPGSPERVALQAELARQASRRIEIPLIIGGQEVHTDQTATAIVPHEHGHVLADVHQAGEAEIDLAAEAAMTAHRAWSRMPWAERAAIFLRAAELLAGPMRQRLNAATMLNQSKTCYQAEIDAACEMVDFLRFNAWYMEQIYRDTQPLLSSRGTWNRIECRPLEGFVLAITPFNFTSIAGNLPSAPALMGTTSIWKPSPSALYSNYLLMRLFMEAGLPNGVINFLPGPAPVICDRFFAHEGFGGVHFTGSTAVFREIWAKIAQHMDARRDYPRIVGETGGKDFIVAHTSADPQALIAALVRGAFEYQGQKCSAASRAYVPRSLWELIRDGLIAQIDTIRMGDPADFTNFMTAVIHRNAFEKCRRYVEAARASSEARILTGGGCDDSVGFFVQPTLIETTDPAYPSMCEEIFGPILTVWVYEDGEYEAALRLCDATSPYALTGAVFGRDRGAVGLALDVLRYAAGNFYINDKPTGAVVGQQPFGGSRASGTNDKAGSALNLLRWISPRTIKETFDPPRDYRYGFLGED